MIYGYYISDASPNRHVLAQNDGNTKTMCEICWKLTEKHKNYVSDGVRMSLFLTLNSFMYCFVVSTVERKHQSYVNHVVLMSLFLTMNRFYALLCCSHCCHGASKFRLTGRSTCSQMFFKIGIFKNFANFTR